jgi:hypothetical protein
MDLSAMFKACVEAVREFFPDCPDDEVEEFLFTVTDYPAVDATYVRKQLMELRATTSTWDEAMAQVDWEMEEAMRRYDERYESWENSDKLSDMVSK